jgi:cobalt-zinc-cadmium efflux system membrane fusion protein
MPEGLPCTLVLALIAALAGLSAAEAGHEPEHDATAAPAPRRPHVHGAHEDDEDGHEADDHGAHGHDEGGGEVHLPAATAARLGIVSEPVADRVLVAPVLAPGRIAWDPAGQAQVATPAPGRVVAVHVQAGSAVRAGDPLVELRSPASVAAQGEWLRRRAAAAIAAHRLETAREDLERGRRAGGGLSSAELRRLETATREAELARGLAEAELAAALAAAHLLGASVADLESLAASGVIAETLVLRAPIAGTVTDCLAIPGLEVTDEEPFLLAIADPARLWAVAGIPEAQLARVAVGSLAELSGADGARLGDGAIAAVAPDIDPRTRSGSARLPIAGTPALRPGMHVQLRITPAGAEAAPRGLAVPEAAVMAIAGHAVVFVAEPAGEEIHFRAQPVLVGPAVGGYVPILSGLEAGTAVVVQGAFLIKADLGKDGAAHEH